MFSWIILYWVSKNALIVSNFFFFILFVFLEKNFQMSKMLIFFHALPLMILEKIPNTFLKMLVDT